MGLLTGTRLGPYEVLAPLGAGGMGEVYRARDTRLGRDVAVKILPAELSKDAVRKQRFEREAKTISSLNHPHICVLHDVGHQDGMDYLVMECVEGETLAKRLEKGPLGLEQVLKYGAQIADALDKAHRSGVVHRDLKPGNIMLTATGAKLLDFGLAKPAVTPASVATLTAAATQTTPMTQEGTIVGTFQYMSPEQVEGKEVDARSDIFSFGAVLYEMLTGQRAFPGKSQLSVASAVLEKEPEPINKLQPMTPPPLDHAIKKSLAKHPDERWQTACDLASELKWIAESGSHAGIPATTTLRPASGNWVGWGLAFVMTVAAILLALAYFRKEPSEVRSVRSRILPPEGGVFVFEGPTGGAVLSPDGHSVAFIARVGKVTQLWIQPLDSFEARALPGTEDVSFVFWSPDSRNLGFFAQGKLKRIAAAGGPAQTLCEADSERGASWGRRDVIIFARVDGEIQSIPASGGTPQRVTSLDVSRHEGTHRWPSFLPDGNHFFYMSALLGPVSEDNAYNLGALDAKEKRRILFHGGSPSAYAMGHMLYLAGNVLMARPFDPVKLDFTGEAVPVAEGVQFDPLFSSAIFSVSENGVLVYGRGKGPVAHSLLLVDRGGKQLENLGASTPGSAPKFSPDGKSVVYDSISTETAKVDLWILNIASGNRTRLASDPLNLSFHSAVWSPDGTRLAYASSRAGNRAIFIKAINQMTPEEDRWEAKDVPFLYATDWTPDGKYLILTERPAQTGSQCVTLLPVEGKSDAEPLLEVKGANLDSGKVSPGGRWIAYHSEESGRSEVYISSFPKPYGKLQVSIAGGVTPRWRGDGKELYYLGPDKMLMAVELKETGGTLQIGSIRPMFEMFRTIFLTAAGFSQYDVTKDGSRFVMDSVVTDESSTPLSLVQNWTADLKKK